ncbi:MAG: cytochrome c oxidase subunit 3 [Verrucomicrobiales bacterium]|jgi:cytochrome c oxidase subunit 3|nr:cytochrome c oxidase subunit 3 [Verrucomicrobiales bacterium]
MQIPYEVEARPDTGLYNAKLGIWLFLASEVMLFGGLFSAYIFLRIGAEPGLWPHQILELGPAFANTMVLIISSVTMVMGWASAKLGEYKKFKIFTGITVLCALAFVGIKSYEYHGDFNRYGVILADKTQVTGELVKDKTNDRQITLIPDAKQSTELGREYLKKQGEGAEKSGEEQELAFDRKDVVWFSNFVPSYSTFFSVYFTMTGLHALHVIGGAVVIFYLWGPGSRMYFTDRKHFVNRLEVAGLFWHFVELVWIFLFPVLYLL